MGKTKYLLEDFIKSLEGKEVKHGELQEQIWRLANTIDTELDELYAEIQSLRGELGL